MSANRGVCGIFATPPASRLEIVNVDSMHEMIRILRSEVERLCLTCTLALAVAGAGSLRKELTFSICNHPVTNALQIAGPAITIPPV